MSAPVTERGRTAVRGRTAAIPAQRGLPGAPAPTAEPRTAGRRPSQRADERPRRGGAARPAAPAGRPQFVLLIMVLLVVGLVATLWLSTAAAADSYRLQDATAEARVLSEQAERLKQDVAVLGSAPELARRAGELGMVAVRDPARLVVATDGSVEVVGEPRAAVAPPPPAPPAPPEGAQPPEGAAPEGTEPEGAAPEGAAPEGTAPEDAESDAESGAEEGTDEEGTDEDGAAQLAAPGTEDAAPEAVDGAAEEPSGGESGDESGGESGDGTAERGTEARAGGGGTDAG